MGNPVSSLPADVDSFLQDVAQMFNGINYTDIMKARLSEKQIGNVRKFHGELVTAWNNEEDDKFKERLRRICNIVKLNKEK